MSNKEQNTVKEWYTTDKLGLAWHDKTANMLEDYAYESVKYFDSEEEAIEDVRKREEQISNNQ